MGEVAETEMLNNHVSLQEDLVSSETFLPPVMLRVLLVEADDSTRQIISALLRKCGYKVAAVRDGLKAWETLKNKSVNIDLVLTEVDLPSISGFSLLTSIMEHASCKNIPVIMMSSHDSVSTAFKCMLNGAVDFLIKPVRRNELRNLWQHVWRRHTISRPSQNITSPQTKLDVAPESNAPSNNSSGSVASTQKNNECSEKTSETQDMSQLKSSLSLSNTDKVKQESSIKFERESAEYNNETGEKSTTLVSKVARYDKISTGLRLGQCYDHSETENQDQDEVLRTELSKADPHINRKIHRCNDELVEHCTGAIDLIATIENLPKSSYANCSFNGGNTAKFDSQLELSLQRDFRGSSPQPTTEERHILNHSNASAFSWYGSSKLLHPLFPSNNFHESHKLSQDTNTTQSGQVDAKLPNSLLEFFPVTGSTYDNKSIGHGNVFHSMFYIESPKSVCQKESSSFPTSISSQSNPKNQNSERSDDATYSTCDQNVNDQSTVDCAMHNSPASGQSSGTSFYHDAVNHNASGVCEGTGSGSDGNAPSVVGNNNFESSMNNDHYDGLRGTNSHRTSQREAALTKFRLKRKDRCYEKKVRYESRKRLADNRPRVKGQFVRQVHSEHPAADAGGY